MDYERVIPRDLFNEGNLLNCLGRLCILLEHRKDAKMVKGVSLARGGFHIVQDPSSGDIRCKNVWMKVRGEAFHVYRSLNSREPWPVHVITEEDEELEVFDAEGNLSKEFLQWITKSSATS